MFNRRGSPFDDFESEFAEMNRMVDRMFEGMRGWDWAQMPANQPVYYGVSVDIGPDGIPHIHQFGNVKPGQKELLESGVREAFVTTVVDDEKNQLRVTAEMPGVSKEGIKVEALEGAIRIHAEGEDRKYDTTVKLQAAVDPDSAAAKYNNGVLEVRLDLAKPPQPKARDVKID